MALIPVSSDPTRKDEKIVTIDKSQRLVLNKKTREFLNFDPERGMNLYLAYDPVNQRVGLAKPDIVRLTDTKPFFFGKGGYVSIRPLISRFQIPYQDGPLHYVYFGNENGWLTFQLMGYQAPDESHKGTAL